MTRQLIALGFALGALVLAPVARADVARIHQDNGDSKYFFDSDALAANGYDTLGDRFKIRPGAARVQLIRPRVEFVGELRKSVEQL